MNKNKNTCNVYQTVSQFFWELKYVPSLAVTCPQAQGCAVICADNGVSYLRCSNLIPNNSRMPLSMQNSTAFFLH